MTSSEEKKCRDCDFKAPVEEWAFVTETRRKVLCVNCSFRDCAREFCSFSAPLKDWKIKADGKPGKWCEHCCDVSVKKGERVKERGRERKMGTYVKIDYGPWEGKPTIIPLVEPDALERERLQELRNQKYIQCPGCKRELLKTSLAKHQAKSCPVSKGVAVSHG
jgi:hypothetical protein